MTERCDNVVKIIAGRNIESNDVRRIFSNIGDISSLHSMHGKDADAVKTIVFVEFFTSENANRAVALQRLMPHIQVLRVVDYPPLIDEYRSLCSSPRVREASCSDDTCSYDSFQMRPMGPSQIQCSEKSCIRERASSPPAYAVASLPTPVSLPSLTPPLGPTSLPQGSQPSDHSSTVVSLDPQLSFAFQGDAFTLNLDNLDHDPLAIVEILRRTSSPMGTWMTSAAYYRHRSNPQVAREIMFGMLSFMNQLGITEDALKPAFLMLSGCETDLAKLAKSNGAEPTSISKHYERSQEYLQKVYGLQAPPRMEPSEPNALRLLFAGTISPMPSQGAPAIRSTSPAHCSSPHNDSARRKSRPSHLPARPLSPGHHVIPRSAKRRLEDQNESERDQRRRLERQGPNSSREREYARRAGAPAVLPLRREREARQRGSRS